MRKKPIQRLLVVGATGSIGRLVVGEALQQSYAVRALIRNEYKASSLPDAAERFLGDVTRPETLRSAVREVDGVIFTLGSDGAGKIGAETIDYGGVRNVLLALGRHRARIALMTSIGVTNRIGAYNQATEAHDWKRRSERLVRASGLPYTIVRPGWFDYNDRDQYQLILRQGDSRHTGTPEDGVVSRQQIAEVLVRSLNSKAAENKTFELAAMSGAPQSDFEPLFAQLTADPDGSLDAVFDASNMSLISEPPQVLHDLEQQRRVSYHSAETL